MERVQDGEESFSKETLRARKPIAKLIKTMVIIVKTDSCALERSKEGQHGREAGMGMDWKNR